MSDLTHADLQQQLEEIAEYMENGDYVAALAAIEPIPLMVRTPLVLSAYALCLAEVEGPSKDLVNLCHEAIKKDPKNPEHFYRQGRVLMLAGRRKDSIWVLRMGLRLGRHKGIIEMLGSLGIRKPPPLVFLSRSNILNKYLGILLTRLKLR
jgi:hypothetical protein